MIRLTTREQISLPKLKEMVREYWDGLLYSNDAIAATDFKAEVRRLFGDLRYTHTWEKAFAHFFVQWAKDCVMDGDLWFKVFDPADWLPWQRQLRFLILDAILADKQAVEATRNSLEYILSINSPELADGLLGLAKEAAGKGTTESPAFFSGRDPALMAAW